MINEAEVRRIFDEALATQESAFGKFFLAKFLQLSINYSNDVCHVSLPVKPHLYNPLGSLHGGVMALVMDISMGHLINHVIGGGGSTLEMKIQYMHPITTGAVRFEGHFMKKGRNVSFLESRAFNDAGKLVGMATSTWKMPANG